MATIHIPRTATRRGSLEWSKVLTRVRPNAESGFDFEGRFLRSGAMVDEDHLFLAGRDPDFAIVLECAGPDRFNAEFPSTGRARFPTLFILWRCDRASSAWRELARASSFDSTWTLDLGPIAIRALQGDSPPAPPDAVASSDRIRWLIESELDVLEGPVLLVVLNSVHDQLAARIAASQCIRG
jgi:hypothetical protein